MSRSQSLQDARGVGSGSRGPGSLLLTLFSLPFCGVGVYAGWRFLAGVGGGEPLGRELALWGVFALTFGVAGFGLLLYARWSGAREGEAATLRARHPEEPWRWRPEWASGRVPAQDTATAVVAWLFAIVWNAMSAPLLFVVPKELGEGNAGAAAFGLLFPLVGAALLVWAVRATLRRRRFGRCVFELATLPGVVGGSLRGTLHVPVQLRPKDGLRLTLTCLHRRSTGHGRRRSTTESVRWQEEATLPASAVTAGPVGSAFPVEFTVPGNVPASSPEPSDDMHVWRLRAAAAVPGIDFQTIFEVPVFRTRESRDDVRTTVLPDASEGRELSPVPEPVTPGARITAAALPDGVELFFPAARSPASAAAITVMALLWNGGIAFVALRVPALVLALLALFAAIGLVIAFAALDAWLGTIRIRARRRELAITRRILGIGRTKVHAAGEIEDLGIEPNGQIGSRVLYALKGRLPGRKKPSTLADGLSDRAEAEQVLGLVERGLGR